MATPLTVLLVEDNPGDARLIRETLRDASGTGWSVEVAARFSEALPSLESGVFNIVLLDLSLPDVQGFDTFAKTHAAAPHVPIVVLTGLSMDQPIEPQAQSSCFRTCHA